MRYLLDTNICIYLIKKKPRQVLQKFDEHSVGDIGVSAITVSELQYGVSKSQHPARNNQALTRFLLPLVVADFDELAAASYGKIRAVLEVQGKPIGAMDLLIAAHAIRLNTVLVTNNVKEFSRIADLEVVNWAGIGGPKGIDRL
jgi:tRNA(fMet)-specific endonuclease VapC